MSTEVETESFDPAIHAVDSDGNPKLNKDGSLAKKRGRKPGSTNTGGTMPRKAAKKASTSGTDYRPGILGMLQIVAVPLTFTAPMDAWTVGQHAPNIAEALNEVAKERPEVANALEKVLQVGPYGLLIGALIPPIVQIAHNHNLLPENASKTLGFVPRSQLAEYLKGAENGESAAA